MARKTDGERWRLAALVMAVAGAALLVGPSSGLDGFSTPKLLAVGIAVAMLLLAGGFRAAKQARLSFPRTLPMVAAAAFALTGLLVALLSPSPWLAFAGAFSRWNGVGFYLGCVVLFVSASRLPRWGVVGLVRAILVVSGLVGLQALNQVTIDVGRMPVDVVGVGSTLGNPNFLAAYSALVLPLAIYGSLARSWPTVWRTVATASLALNSAAIFLAGSAQGFLVALAGGAILLLVAASLRWSGIAMRIAVGAAACAGLLGGALLAFGAAGYGPLGTLSTDVGIQRRIYYWQAAGGMAAENAIQGVGPGHFAYYYRAFRPMEHALTSRLGTSTDAAHSVPLQIFSEGGLLWGLPYLAFLVAVSILAWRAILAASGSDRLLVGAIAAAWTGYLLQSLISIDMLPLGVLGWALAGMLAATAPPADKHVDVRIPWRRRTRKGAPASAAERLGRLIVVLVAGLTAWAASIPYRADLAASDPAGLESVAAGNELPDRATELAHWEPEYWLRLADPLADRGDLGAASSVASTAANVAPRDLEAILTSARAEAALDNIEQARERYEQALRIEPQHPDVALEAAQFALDVGDEDWAMVLTERVLEIDPSNEAAHELMGRVDASEAD